MTTAGPNSTGTVADDASYGTITWSNPTYAQVSDAQYATAARAAGTTPFYDNPMLIVKGGVIRLVGLNPGLVSPNLNTDTWISFGNATEHWNTYLQVADVNASNFGFAFAMDIEAGAGSAFTHYLKATNFGFSIPSNARIDGILLEIQAHYDINGGTGVLTVSVNSIRATIYYTLVGAMMGVQSITGIGSITF